MKWLVVFAGLVSMALAYKAGPPLADYPGVCGTMTPNHTTTNEGRSDASPYEIILDSTCYSKNIKIAVELKSKSANSTYYYEGLMVQVRKLGDASASYGTFTFDSAEVQLQVHDCLGGSKNTITHKDGAHFFTKEFTWKSPDTDQGELEFVATVVHETEDFWLGLKSSKIQYCDGATSLTVSALLLALVSFTLLL